MSRRVILTCNCGCNATVDEKFAVGWFKFSAYPPNDDQPSHKPKLKEDLFFSSLACAAKWFQLTMLVLPELQKTAAELSPRGQLSDPKVPEMYL